MRDLPGNAVVWPADQTKKIMSSAANGKNFGSAASHTETISKNSYIKSNNNSKTSKKAEKTIKH